MRRARIALIFTLLVASAPPALAEDTPRDRADTLVREGAALGEAGDWDGAIARFRQAEALFPRAMHDCNVGLAFMRSERPHAGWLFLTRCQARTTEPLPAWVDARRREALTALAAGDYAPVEVVAAPRSALVRVDALPDDVFTTPLTLWLPLGQHTLVVTAPGHVEARVPLGLADRAPLRRTVTLEAEPEPDPPTPVAPEPNPPNAVAPDPPDPAPLDPPPPAGRVAAWVLLGAGVVAAGVGAGLYAVADATSAHGDTLPPGPEFDANLAAFERERGFSYGLLGVGAVAIGVGVTLLLLPDVADHRASGAPVVDLSPLSGGGLLTLSGAF